MVSVAGEQQTVSVDLIYGSQPEKLLAQEDARRAAALAKRGKHKRVSWWGKR